jgi:hypothetical protein
MNPFAHFERLAERIFEQDLPRVLGGQLDPLELTRAIDHALDALPRGAPPPAALRLEIAEESARALAGRTAAVEAELGRYAAARVRERWPGEAPAPIVRLVLAPGLGKREARAFPDTAAPATRQTAALPPAATPTTAVRVTICHGDRVISVDQLPLTIGRALDNDVILDERSVSRYHAQIREASGELVVVDLQSTNGTFLNGQRVLGTARLRDRDTLMLGGVSLRVRLGHRR